MKDSRIILSESQFDALLSAIDTEDISSKSRSQIKAGERYFERGRGNRSVTLEFGADDLRFMLIELENKMEEDLGKVELFLLNAESLGFDIKTFSSGIELVQKLRKVTNNYQSKGS